MILFSFSLCLYALASYSSEYAEIIDANICFVFRRMLALISSIVSFSIFELLLLISPLFLFFILRWIFKAQDSRIAGKRFFSALSCVGIFTSAYVFTLGIALKKPNISDFEHNIESDSLYQIAEYLAVELSSLPSNCKIEICDIKSDLEQVYSDLYSKNIKLGRPKQFLFSKLFSRTGALALYSFPTGEVNISKVVPSYMIPFTMAHEYAHFLGAGCERDADYIAFVACINSGSSHIKYSGILSGLEFILQDAYKISSDLYIDIYNLLPETAKMHISEYRCYSNRYGKSNVTRFFSAANSVHGSAAAHNGKQVYSDITEMIITYLGQLS